jgi:pimeloyl-ACP methyl ester carboxylesterase
MATFALVHGARCWERLTLELEAHGHRVVTMDLPCEDGSLSFDDYAETVCAAVEDVQGAELVLVGHSLAGLTIPLVASHRPVHQLVYLCALLPIPGTSVAQQMSEDPEMLDPDYPKGLSAKDSEGRRTWIDIRPQATNPYRLPCSLAELPAVASTYVVCTEDRIVNPEWSRRIAHERLGADVIEMPGSHSPFLSRPKVLAELLKALV